MKIERGPVTITDIPHFDRILITPTSIDLDRDGPIDYATEEIEAIRDALTEAIRIKREIDGVPAEPLRVFYENDLEPGPEITKVVDVDGATWHRHPRGWSLSGDAGSATKWSNVLQFTPLTEVRDA